MGRIKMLAPLVPKGDGRTVKPEPKRADPFYQSAGHEAFRHAHHTLKTARERARRMAANRGGGGG
jgi:hypothetical protein